MSEDQATASKFRRLVELRESRDQTKTAAENAEKDYRSYEADLFQELDESPIEGTRRIDLGPPFGKVTFSPRSTKYGRIIDADAAAKYFEDHDMGEEMLKSGISKGKLNELVREYLEQGKPMPDGVDFITRDGITISRKG